MSRNIRILPDYQKLDDLPNQTAHQDYDVLILPGGAPGAKTFCSSPDVLALISSFRRERKWVAAICAATTALVAAEDIATGKTGGEGKKRVTSHPSVKEEVKQARWEYSEEVSL